MDVLEERLPFVFVGKLLAKQEIGEQILVRFVIGIRMTKNRLDLRSEDERLAVVPVVQRPAPDRIAREDQPPVLRVERGQREIACQPLKAAVAPGAKCPEDDVGIGGFGVQDRVRELPKKLLAIVESAIENERVAIQIDQRLAFVH